MWEVGIHHLDRTLILIMSEALMILASKCNMLGSTVVYLTSQTPIQEVGLQLLVRTLLNLDESIGRIDLTILKIR